MNGDSKIEIVMNVEGKSSWEENTSAWKSKSRYKYNCFPLLTEIIDEKWLSFEVCCLWAYIMASSCGQTFGL